MKYKAILLCVVLLFLFSTVAAASEFIDPLGSQSFLSVNDQFSSPTTAFAGYNDGYSTVVTGDGEWSESGTGFIPPYYSLSNNQGTVATGPDTTTIILDDALVGAVTGSSTNYPSSGYNLPSDYDLRDTGRLPPVEDQGDLGTCWAFATFTSLESVLPENIDFSENNMRNLHGFDIDPDQGGSILIATAYLARWGGPVSASDDPYPSGRSVSEPAVEHVQDVFYIPAKSGSQDNAHIKSAIVTLGAVYSTIYWNDKYYNPETASYYYSGSRDPNHAVNIVGWDDDYSRDLFEPPAPGDGAFVVRNSWGPDWGDDGYCYVSYYDTTIGRDNAVFTAESADNYNSIYQYDPLGRTGAMGYESDTAYFGNVFTSMGPEDLAAVSFYTPVENSKYEITVYTNPSNGPVSGSPVTTTSGTIGVPGYHTIPLAYEVSLSTGERFSVVVRITTPGYQYPVSIESPQAGFSSAATASPGESYASSDGMVWEDLTDSYPDTNVCLKAFTR